VAVGVATATLVAAGAADLHRASTHHHKASTAAAAAGAQAPAGAQTPVALSASTAQQRSAPLVRHASAATARKHRHHHSAAEHTSGTSTTSPSTTQRLPATQAGSGTFPDAPPPQSTEDHPAGKVNPPTDPANQPIGAPEPVQVQGFDPQQGSGGSSDASGTTGP
jgi:hypothetical protein